MPPNARGLLWSDFFAKNVFFYVSGVSSALQGFLVDFGRGQKKLKTQLFFRKRLTNKIQCSIL
jgi:hypothetical protein